MSDSSEEFRIRSSLVALLIVLTAILSFIGTLEIALNGSVGSAFMCRYAWGTVSKTMDIPLMGFIVILLAYPFKLLKGRLSASTLVLLYIVGTTVAMYGIGHYETFACWPVGFARTLLYTEPDFLPVAQSWWWMPPYDVVQLINQGGAATDWGAWSGAILFWSFYLIAFFLFGSSLMLLFRRRWLDIERVPFPYVLAAHELIRNVSGEPREKKVTKWFVIGFVVALLFELQVFSTYLFPWWPDLLAWRGTAVDSTSPQGCVCIYPNDPIESALVWWPGYTKNLLPFLVYYLAPLNVTFTVWVFFILMVILAQIAYIMGYYTGVFETGSFCRMEGLAGFHMSPLFGPPYYWIFQGMIGGTLAVTVMMMFHARSYLAETIRLAMRGGRSPEEANEPFTYRQIYTFIILSAIILLAFCFSAGLSIGTSLAVLIVLGFVNTVAAAYVLGLSGCGYLHNIPYWPSWPLRFIWPTAPQNYSTDWVMSNIFFNMGINHATHGPTTGAYLTIQNLKMSGMAKMNLKDTFILTSIAAIIAIFVANSTRVWVVNLLGVNRVPVWGSCSVTNYCFGAPNLETYNEVAPLEVQLSAAGAGFIITVILSLLNARFIWWPLHPIGFVIATSMGFNMMREWNAMLGAWIAKFLTLRVGGSRAYEEYGVPFVSGGIAGYAL
ncbi:hypothetical protein DRO58_02415, partial [Candidatus Bathyarchaeota archaeon]